MLRDQSPTIIRRFLQDSSGEPHGAADEVALPVTTLETAELLKEAYAVSRPVTVAGNGTGLNGGRIPHGGLVLATERMDRIFEVGHDLRRKEGYASVQPGVTLTELREYLAVHGWEYKPDPTEGSCTLGGTLATNASGARSFLWGPTRAHVMGIEVVLATGDVLELVRGQNVADIDGNLVLPIADGRTISLRLPLRPGPRVKNSAGYFLEPQLDAVDLFIGQEGTLGVITRIDLRLIQKTRHTLGGVVFFESEADAFSWVQRVREASRSNLPGGGGVRTVALEFLDKCSLDLVQSDTNAPSQMTDTTAAAVYVEQEIQETESPTDIRTAWEHTVTASGAKALFTFDPGELKSLHAWRHEVPARINAQLREQGVPKVGTDAAVPDAAFASYWTVYERVIKEWAGRYALWGHIGDNHLHLNLLPDTLAEVPKAKALQERLALAAIPLGGTVSAEHGIGKTKHHLLRAMVGDARIQDYRDIKRQLDLKGILSPGNIFPI